MILFTNEKEAPLEERFELVAMAGRQCYVFLPDNYQNEDKSYPVVYLNGDKFSYSLLKEADFLSEISFIIIIIISEKRLDELTPWKSSSLHPKFPDFGGEGNKYIKFLETQLKPTVDLSYRTLPSPKSTGIMGYSLGGLISIYAAFNTTSFGCFASMSGSFWYPEFILYARNKSINNSKAKFYISSGDREGIGHKDIKKDSFIYTMQIYHILIIKSKSFNVSLFLDKGGHHDNILQRYKNTFLWLNNNIENN